jgi:hypothetical protein
MSVVWFVFGGVLFGFDRSDRRVGTLVACGGGEGRMNKIGKRGVEG